MAYFKDLREHLEALEAKGKLIRIKRAINKDTELHPLVRLQFRGLPEKERKAFLFENVIDSKGRSYNIPVAVGALASSKDIYALGLGCAPEEILERWTDAQLNPIEPETVKNGPVQEEIHIGNNLLAHGGMDEFPIPISTPGYDAGPFITSPYWVTKDPVTGVHNVGTYRAHVKSSDRTGIKIGSSQRHIALHWNKCKERGIPLEAAIVVEAAPNIGYVSVALVPYKISEYAFAGGLAKEPVPLVKCKTVDLLVPATAEIVIEGEVSTTEQEPEAPFGEAGGYMSPRDMMPYFTVKYITHRKNPIWQSFLSQFPPSESSKIRQIFKESGIYKCLKYDHGLSKVLAVAEHESACSVGHIVIQQKGMEQSEVWRTLEAVHKWSITHPPAAKVIMVVDEDIAPWDADILNWVWYTRVNPMEDCRIESFTLTTTQDHAALSPAAAEKIDAQYKAMPETSTLLVNGTIKWPYPPLSLPKKEFMERALKIWKEENLPSLTLKEPWYGYNLGHWSAEDEEHARLATKGEYHRVGQILSQRRVKI